MGGQACVYYGAAQFSRTSIWRLPSMRRIWRPYGRHSRSFKARSSRFDEQSLRHALLDEQLREQELDRQYWAPLRKVLEELRRERRKP
jgi:hypothetical protein